MPQPTPNSGQSGPISCWILTIGDELLAGDIVDTNKALLARRCRELGIEVRRAISVRDRIEEIVEVLDEAGGATSLCLISGGLGPTTDDLTARAVSRAAGVGMRRDPQVEAGLREFFAGRDPGLIESNLQQADFPEGAEVLDNPIGTAPGFTLGFGSGPCLLASMPCVPRELERMMREELEPKLRSRFELRPVARRVHRIVGHGESTVQHRIAELIESARKRSPGLANMFVHYRARYPEVQVCFEAIAPGRGPSASGGGKSAASPEELASLDGPMAAALAPGYVGIGETEFPERVVRRLIDCGQTLATAESCTGGLVGEMLTSVPGSSSCYLGGVVSYANSAKRELLDVDPRELEEHGAVSEPIARAMAEGARGRLGSDLAVAITGIAGPAGGSEEKPVGTVDFAVSGASGTDYRRLHLFGKRGTVRRAAAIWALKFVWDRLDATSGPTPFHPHTEAS
jgi:nicotinamide-nucleotide amidase